MAMINQWKMKEVEWKKRSQDLISEERVDIHPYMNGDHITYVPHTFMD
jgi:hypothetical protein